jgi:hypothetical protein
LAVIAAFLGMSLATAGTATADPGYWRAYGNKNPITSSASTWECGRSVELYYQTNVVAQTCAVKNVARDGAQAALIVRNNRSSTYIVSAATDLRSGFDGLMGVWRCPSSGVAANSWSVCFGVTLPIYPVRMGDVNGKRQQHRQPACVRLDLSQASLG